MVEENLEQTFLPSIKGEYGLPSSLVQGIYAYGLPGYTRTLPEIYLGIVDVFERKVKQSTVISTIKHRAGQRIRGSSLSCPLIGFTECLLA